MDESTKPGVPKPKAPILLAFAIDPQTKVYTLRGSASTIDELIMLKIALQQILDEVTIAIAKQKSKEEETNVPAA